MFTKVTMEEEKEEVRQVDHWSGCSGHVSVYLSVSAFTIRYIETLT